MFVNDLWLVDGILWIPLFSPPIKLPQYNSNSAENGA
jgi:hypothetical protein